MIAPKIIEHFPDHHVYVEPFGGAASVMLQKARAHSEVYNDLDGEVVNLFRVVRTAGSELVAALELTPFAREEFRLSYEPCDDPVEQARRTVVRSFMGFGSNSHVVKTGFRANSSGSGRAPARDWQNYPEQLVMTIERLRGVCIENRPAIDVMAHHDGDDTLHYVDPPYVHASRGAGADGHHRGYRHEMTDEQHRELAEFLGTVRGMVVLSGYHSELYDELYADWTRVEFAALADGAKERTEVLWLKNISSAQATLPL